MFSLIKYLLLSAALSGFASGLSASPIQQCDISFVSEPRSIEYEWMDLATWYQQHTDDIKVADTQSVDLLFIGDSITAAWPSDLWNKYFAPYKAANFAIGGDTTQNLLWRLQHGNAAKLKPKVVNILIGVNNMGLENATPQQAYCGIMSVVNATQLLYPNAQILLNQLLPWGEHANSPLREKVKTVNTLLSERALSSQVTLFQFGKQLLKENGDIDKRIMADFLHPTTAGYQIYAKHLQPQIQTLIKK